MAPAMRYVAPARDAVDPQVFGRLPLRGWDAFGAWLHGPAWPGIDAFNRRLPAGSPQHFVAQTRALIDDGLHYESRIAERGQIATRLANWHDLFNAMVWLRYPQLKRALNARQVEEIGHMGPRDRSRAQYALTHFDEAGVIVRLNDPGLLALWDAHDWHGLFWRRREAWCDGSAEVHVFGHALLEHALTPEKLLVGKAMVVLADGQAKDDVIACCAQAIAEARALNDPLELRPLPLSGLPGWRDDNDVESFHVQAACYQPRREGRRYPAPISAPSSFAQA